MLAVDVDPVLVEVVGAGSFGVEPNGARFGLSHLFAVAFDQQFTRQTVELYPGHSSGQVDSGGDVPPLVAPAELNLAAVTFVQHHKVVRLKKHVAELSVAQAAVGSFEPALDRVFGEHYVDRKMLPDVAQKIEEGEIFHPLEVVQKERSALLVEVEKGFHLRADRTDVAFDRLGGEELTLFALSARVADHAGGAPDQGDRTMPGALGAAEVHDRDQVPHMERRAGRIEAGVDNARLFEEEFINRFVGHLIQKTAPFQVGNDIMEGGHRKIYSLSLLL